MFILNNSKFHAIVSDLQESEMSGSLTFFGRLFFRIFIGGQLRKKAIHFRFGLQKYSFQLYLELSQRQR